VKTLLLAERPFRDLRSRALIGDLPEALALAEPALLLSDAPHWPPGFASVSPATDLATLDLGRVVIAGSHLERVGFDRVLALAARAVRAGARLELRRFSLGGGAMRPTAPDRIGVLDAAQVAELRDYATADTLLGWRMAAPFRLMPYPERAGPRDDALAEGLPDGPVLGLAMLGGEAAAAVLDRHLAALRARLAPYRGWPILPLPADPVGGPADDYPGTLAFAEAVLPSSPVLLPELADPLFRRRKLTASRMRGLVARCGLVVASQDLPIALAIGQGVKVLGIAMAPERRVAVCIATLANALPEGSDLLMLR